MTDIGLRKTAHGPSFLRWAGSKRKALAHLSIAYNNRELQYIEPFAGSAALFFASDPRAAILGDLNGHLINAMRNVRDSPIRVYEWLTSLERSSENYYIYRNKFNDLPPSGMESAVLFIYLNRNCFNGIWRTNLSGHFNVPHGGAKMGSIPPLSLFQACSKTLKKAKLKHQDFRKTISQANEKSFIYADPPYFNTDKRTFVEYGKRSFDKRDLQDLIDCLLTAEKNGSHIALSYSEAIPITVPSHWKQKRFEVTRNVGGFSGSRRKHTEILYTSMQLGNCDEKVFINK